MTIAKLIERLKETWALHITKAETGERYLGFELRAFADEAKEAAQALASSQEEIERLKLALKEERDRNRKLHRRLQTVEAVNESVEGILASWKGALRHEDGRRKSDHLLFGIALDDITSRRKKIAARALASKAGAA